MTPEEQIRMTLLLETMLKSAGVYDEVIDCMKAYSLHVLERFERDIDAYDESNLKPFFEEIKKELK